MLKEEEKSFLTEAWGKMGFALNREIPLDTFREQDVPELFIKAVEKDEQDRVVPVLRPFLFRKKINNEELVLKALTHWYKDWAYDVNDFVRRRIEDYFYEKAREERLKNATLKPATPANFGFLSTGSNPIGYANISTTFIPTPFTFAGDTIARVDLDSNSIEDARQDVNPIPMEGADNVQEYVVVQRPEEVDPAAVDVIANIGREAIAEMARPRRQYTQLETPNMLAMQNQLQDDMRRAMFEVFTPPQIQNDGLVVAEFDGVTLEAPPIMLTVRHSNGSLYRIEDNDRTIQHMVEVGLISEDDAIRRFGGSLVPDMEPINQAVLAREEIASDITPIGIDWAAGIKPKEVEQPQKKKGKPEITESEAYNHWNDFCEILNNLTPREIYEGKIGQTKLLKRIKSEARKCCAKFTDEEMNHILFDRYNDRRSEMVDFMKNFDKIELVGTKLTPYTLGMSSLSPNKDYNSINENGEPGDEKKWRSCQMLCKFASATGKSHNSLYADVAWANVADPNSIVLYITSGQTKFAGMNHTFDNMLARVVLRAFKTPDSSISCGHCGRSMSSTTKIAGMKEPIFHDNGYNPFNKVESLNGLNADEIAATKPVFYNILTKENGEITSRDSGLYGQLAEIASTRSRTVSGIDATDDIISYLTNKISDDCYGYVGRSTWNEYSARHEKITNNQEEYRFVSLFNVTINGTKHKIWNNTAIQADNVYAMMKENALYIAIARPFEDSSEAGLIISKFNLNKYKINDEFPLAAYYNCRSCSHELFVSDELVIDNSSQYEWPKMSFNVWSDKIKYKEANESTEYVVFDRFYPNTFFSQMIIDMIREVCAENNAKLAWYRNYNAVQKEGSLKVSEIISENCIKEYVASPMLAESIMKYPPCRILGAFRKGEWQDEDECGCRYYQDNENCNSCSSCTIVPYQDNARSTLFSGTTGKKYYYLNYGSWLIPDDNVELSIETPEDMVTIMEEGVNW